MSQIDDFLRYLCTHQDQLRGIIAVAVLFLLLSLLSLVAVDLPPGAYVVAVLNVTTLLVVIAVFSALLILCNRR